jgi:hypothetical protein
LIAAKQALFLTYKESAIPIKVGPLGTKLYAALLMGLTSLNQISAFAIVFKQLFLDLVNNLTHQSFSRYSCICTPCWPLSCPFLSLASTMEQKYDLQPYDNYGWLTIIFGFLPALTTFFCTQSV